MKKIILLLLAFPILSEARWATKEDLSFSIAKSNTEIVVNKDGTFIENDEVVIEILKEAGRQQLSLYSIPYNSNSSKVKVLEAKVINLDETIIVQADKIIDRAKANTHALDDKHEVQIAFPKLKVGSKISLKVKTEHHKVIIPGHFFLHMDLSKNLIESGTVKITAAFPLKIKVNDPFQNLKMDSKADGKELSLTIRQPILNAVVEESGSLSLEQKTLVIISSAESWNAIASSLKPGFDLSLSSKIPEELKKIIVEAKKIKDPKEQINFTVAHMTQAFNYVGDWRTLNGGFAPRKLQEIFDTKYGDCKDFASVLVTTLRQLQIKADVALVFRSSPDDSRLQNGELASMDLFNHAIVRVEINNEVFWVDPTNKESYGINHRPDIAGKLALSLVDNAILEKIPSSNLAPDALIVRHIMTFESAEKANVVAELEMKGLMALMMTGKEDATNKAALDNAILNLMGQYEKKSFPEIQKYNLKEKSFKDLIFKAKYLASDVGVEKDGIRRIIFPSLAMFFSSFNHNFDRWEGDLYLGDPQVIKRRYHYKGIFAKGKLPSLCEVKSPWINVKQKLELVEDGIVFIDEMETKSLYIPKDKFKSTDFDLLMSNISDCASEYSLSYAFGSGKHEAEVVNFEKLVENLAGKNKLNRRITLAQTVLRRQTKELTLDDAQTLMELNLLEDKAHPETHQVLARITLKKGYYNGDNYNSISLQEGLEILEKGLALNNQHQGLLISYANTLFLAKKHTQAKEVAEKALAMGEPQTVFEMLNLSATYEYLKNEEKAEHYILLALSTSTDDKEKSFVHNRIADQFADKGNYQKCVEHYEASFLTEKDNNWGLINVTSCYMGLKKYDEAVSSAEKAFKINPHGMVNTVLSQALVARGYALLNENKLEQAEIDLKNSILKLPSSHAFLYLANILIRKNEIDKAYNMIEESEKLLSSNLFEHYSSSTGLFLKHPEHYAKLFQKTLSMSKNPEKILNFYKNNVFHLSHFEDRSRYFKILKESIAYGEAAIKQNPESFRINADLGMIYSNASLSAKNPDMKTRARAYLLKAEALQPGVKEVVMNLETLNLLEKGRMPSSVGK